MNPGIVSNLWLLPAVPLTAAVVILTLGKSRRKSAALIAIGGQIVALAISVALVDHLIEVYSKANPKASPSEVYFLIASDQKFVAPSMKIAERRAELGKAPVYLYYFCWETPVNGGKLKTPHGMEVPMVFDNVKISARTTGGGAEAMALADKVSDAWIAFARTGNPNTPKLPKSSSKPSISGSPRRGCNATY